MEHLIAIATMIVTAVTLEYIHNNIRELETRFEPGLTSQYYTDEFDTIETPYPAQLLAALRCFIQLYQCNNVWVHLASPMQAGKTGVMVTLTRLVMKHYARLSVGPTRMFVFTGMSDNDWRTQTKSRFPVHIRTNIYHRSGLTELCRSLRRLRQTGHLRNILLFIDESHIATKKEHTPRIIYQTLTELCPRDQWATNNIRIVTVSATDPAKVMTIRSEDGLPSRVVRLDTTDDYLSIEKLVRDGRIKAIVGNAHTPSAIDAMKPVINNYEEPRYHIIRCGHMKAAETQANIAVGFPDALFITYDSTSRSDAGGESDSADLVDINGVLETRPSQHTFILIKNAFYAAKTLNDTYVGVLYDRQSDNDSAVLQGLAGRACGYGKRNDTVVFTVPNAIERYLKTWRSLCLSTGNMALDADNTYNAPAQAMNLRVENDGLRVHADELNPILASDEVLAQDTTHVPRPRPAALEHKVEFFPVGNDSIQDVVTRVMHWIRNNQELHEQVRSTKFDKRTSNAIEKHRDDERRYLSSFGNKNQWRVRTRQEMESSRQNLSFENNHPARLQACYDGDTLGLALRYLTGNTIN